MFVLGHIGLTVGIVYLGLYMLEDKRLLSVDLRVLVIGAMLPDIIDKTLGIVILPDTFGHGRLYFHSLLFGLMFLAVAMLAKKIWLQLLGVGVILHLILDSMWSDKEIFLWPLYGLDLPTRDFEAQRWIEMFLTEPYIQVTEGIGLVIIIAIGYRHGMLGFGGIKGILQNGKLWKRDEG